MDQQDPLILKDLSDYKSIDNFADEHFLSSLQESTHMLRTANAANERTKRPLVCVRPVANTRWCFVRPSMVDPSKSSVTDPPYRFDTKVNGAFNTNSSLEVFIWTLSDTKNTFEKGSVFNLITLAEHYKSGY